MPSGETSTLDARFGQLLRRYVELVGTADGKEEEWQTLVNDAFAVIVDAFPVGCRANCEGNRLCDPGEGRGCLRALWYGPFWWVRTMGQGPNYDRAGGKPLVPTNGGEDERLVFQTRHGVWLDDEHAMKSLAVLVGTPPIKRDRLTVYRGKNATERLPLEYAVESQINVTLRSKSSTTQLRSMAQRLSTVYRAWDDLLNAAERELAEPDKAMIFPLIESQETLLEDETKLCRSLSAELFEFIVRLRKIMLSIKANWKREVDPNRKKPRLQMGYEDMMHMLQYLEKVHTHLHSKLRERFAPP